MRRLVSMFIPVNSFVVLVVLVVLVVVVAMMAAWLGGLGPASAQPSPEPAATPAVGPEVVAIDVVDLPQVGASEDDYILYLTQVTFEPNVPAPAAHTHTGQFVLTVDSGAVCYELGPKDSSTTVTAVIPSNAPTNPACGGTQVAGCGDVEITGTRTCTLESGDTIYLPEGSSLTQTGDTNHTYGNIEDVPAVVYLAGHETDRPGAGCRGGCM